MADGLSRTPAKIRRVMDKLFADDPPEEIDQGGWQGGGVCGASWPHHWRLSAAFFRCGVFGEVAIVFVSHTEKND
jgi:hypothetical protein